HGQWNKPSK
nr:Chain P, Prion protein [synthetic construct]